MIRTEDETRRFALQKQQWKLEDDERKRAEAARPARPIEAKSTATVEAAVGPGLEALLDSADAFERAARIRRYVAAVKAAHYEEDSADRAAELERWAQWALQQADLIDPIVSGALLSVTKP